jgi:Ca2+-binding RTX toxin-like protein
MAPLSKSLLGLGAVSPNLGLYIDGTDLADTLYGTAYADEIHGRFGNDVLFGGGGDDLLFGEEGNDSLMGGTGNDRLDGGDGNDTLTGGAGADALIGGSGFDTASYASSSGYVYVNLLTKTGVGGDAQGDTLDGIDKVIGTSFNDSFVADDTGNVFEGGAGNDYLVGGAGLDVLNGGTGDDNIEGGRGLDVLTGGAGADYFIFSRGDGPDVVMDFQQGVDKIILGTGLNFLPFGHDLELLSGTELPPEVSHWRYDDRVFYDTDDHQLYELTPHGEATLLVTFANPIQLQTSDFVTPYM